MQKLISSHIPSFRFHRQTEVEVFSEVDASTYHLNLAPLLNCFVLTTVPKDEWQPSTYGVILIHGEHKKILDYEPCVDTEMFESDLLPTLEQGTEQQCKTLMNQYGYGIVSESALSLEKRFLSHGLVNARPHLVELLNISAIEVLKQLRLGIVPKLYNWLTEVSEQQYHYRSNALLNYPIVLIPIMVPVVGDMFPTLLNREQLAIRPSAPETIISQRIDQGEPIEAILKSTLHLSDDLLAAIKGKRFWEITPDTQQKIYTHFEDEIQVYALMSSL